MKSREHFGHKSSVAILVDFTLVDLDARFRRLPPIRRKYLESSRSPCGETGLPPWHASLAAPCLRQVGSQSQPISPISTWLDDIIWMGIFYPYVIVGKYSTSSHVDDSAYRDIAFGKVSSKEDSKIRQQSLL